MTTSEITYIGDLRTVSTHVRSKNTLTTDAPLDNQGKGEAFSPTDLLATSLGCCMLTIMGIAARARDISIDGTKVSVTKIMSEKPPRKVAEIHLRITLPHKGYTEEVRKLLYEAAIHCPVARSLDPDIIQKITLD
jgi:uncharacterized OsmC-like protein